MKNMCKACELEEGKVTPSIAFLTGVLWARGAGSKQTFDEFQAECCSSHRSYLEFVKNGADGIAN